MKSRKTYIKASTFYFVGNIFDKAIAFITVPIFTRLLSTYDYGMASTYLSWTNILAVVITLSLGYSVRTAIVDYKEMINGYIASVILLEIIIGTIVSTTIYIAMNLCGKKYNIYTMLTCCTYAVANNIVSAIQTRYMMEVKYIQRTLLQCVPNIITVVISILLICRMDDEKYLGRVYAYFIVTLIFAVFYILYYFKYIKYININYWKYALSVSIPLIFNCLSNVVLVQADRSMLTSIRGADETGVYSLAYQFGMIPLVFTTTVESAWIPWFTGKFENNEYDRVKKMTVPYIYIVMILCSCVILFAPEVLFFMTTKDFFSAKYIITPVIISTFYMFLSSIFVDFEYYFKDTRMIARNTIIAAVSNVVLNLIFIPLYGGIAASYTTAVSYGVLFILHFFYVKNHYGKFVDGKRMLLSIVLLNMVAAVSISFLNIFYLRWGIGIVLLIGLCKYLGGPLKIMNYFLTMHKEGK